MLKIVVQNQDLTYSSFNVAEDSSLDLSCRYKLAQPISTVRSMDGGVIRQSSYGRILNLSISGSGWKPSILGNLTTNSLISVQCTSPILVPYTLSILGRIDFPYAQRHMEVRNNIMMEKTDWDLEYPELTPSVPNPKKPVLQSNYTLYFPVLSVYIDSIDSGSDSNGNHTWSMECTSASTY